MTGAVNKLRAHNHFDLLIIILLIVIRFLVRPNPDVVIDQPGKSGDKASGGERFSARAFPQNLSSVSICGSFGGVWYSSAGRDAARTSRRCRLETPGREEPL